MLHLFWTHCCTEPKDVPTFATRWGYSPCPLLGQKQLTLPLGFILIVRMLNVSEGTLGTLASVCIPSKVHTAAEWYIQCLSVCALMSRSSGMVLCAVILILTSCLLIQSGHYCTPSPWLCALWTERAQRVHLWVAWGTKSFRAFSERAWAWRWLDVIRLDDELSE